MITSTMISCPISNKLDKKGSLILNNLLPGILYSLVDSQSIVAVNPQSFDSIRGSPSSDVVSPVLVLNGSGDGVLVVPADEHGLAAESGCEVESSMEVTLTSCAFPEVGGCYLLLVVDPVTVPRPTSLW